MPVRVLIVDDQAPFRAAARAVVERTAGFAVAGAAASGEAAVAAAGASAPDLVLLDVHLPGIGGEEAARRILRAASDTPPVVLLLSTHEAAEYAPRAATCGAAAYLHKVAFGADTLAAAWAAAGRAAADAEVSVAD
jgi:DNA-binding NarL/FixJ family response regulator